MLASPRIRTLRVAASPPLTHSAADENFWNEVARRMKNIYVGNLPYSMTDDGLRELFAAHGEVQSAKVIMDRDTGRARGFGFVEMTDDAAATAAIEALNETDCDGRNLKVNEAKPRTERPRNDRPSW